MVLLVANTKKREKVTVEFYSKDECGLCDETRKILKKLKKEFSFDLNETKLSESHPQFSKYFMAVPVVKVGSKELAGQIREDELRESLRELNPPTRLFYFGKSLEALGFLTVAVGLMYGIMGNMWIDLYFFLAGIVVFSVGRNIEKRELKKVSKMTSDAQSSE